MTTGFLLVDKPGGWTSHDVVARVRRLAGIKKVGHAGTLDPMATGLLVIGMGRATRLLRYVQEQAKEYVATMVLGVATDTLDADGAILSREPMPVSEDEVAVVAARFVGVIEQVPPMVSAIKVDGRRLYQLAREGKEVDRPSRQVEIHEVQLVDFAPGEYPEATIRVRCGSGTYIRTLADDIAAALGGRAHLSVLRRTAIGSHLVERAHTVAHLEETGELPVLTPADGLADLPEVTVADDVVRGVVNGAVFPTGTLGIEGLGAVKVLDGSGALLAVYRAGERGARPEVVLAA